MAIPYFACMALVASYYDLPPRVLPAIQLVEGGRPGIASVNRNGTADLGVMQVNTVWLPALARAAGLDETAVRERLLHDACFNIAAAGAILRTQLDAAGGDLMRAVGNYHSRTPLLHEAYRARVMGAASRLFAARPPGRGG
jgi:soluble lytic murein transglycosylase-like protein